MSDVRTDTRTHGHTEKRTHGGSGIHLIDQIMRKGGIAPTAETETKAPSHSLGTSLKKKRQASKQAESEHMYTLLCAHPIHLNEGSRRTPDPTRPFKRHI